MELTRSLKNGKRLLIRGHFCHYHVIKFLKLERVVSRGLFMSMNNDTIFLAGQFLDSFFAKKQFHFSATYYILIRELKEFSVKHIGLE